MAKLPDSVLTNIFTLQRHIIESIDATTATELELLRMNDQFRIPDAETRARSIANLREAGRMLDLLTLDLDEIIALLDKDLREQRRARLMHRSNSVPTTKVEN